MAKLLSSLPNGALVKFGKHQVGSETAQAIVWMVVDKNHKGYLADSVTLMAQKIIDLRAYDAKQKPYYPEEEDYTINDYYAVSNLHQWLNSDASANKWYSPNGDYDNPPTADTVDYGTEYQARAGFLYNFTLNEKLAILSTPINVTNGSKINSILAKVFIPTEREVLGTSDTMDETTRLSYLATIGTQCGLTSQAYTNTSCDVDRKPASATDNWRYWTRTDSGYSRPITVTASGLDGDSQVYDGSVGIRPIINLSINERVSDTADADGCYTVKFNTAPVITVTSNDSNTTDIGVTPAYKVTDADSDSVTVKEYIDDELIRSYVSTLGQTYTVDIKGATWLKLANGSHTIKIVANDGFVEVSKEIPFTKSVSSFTVQRATAIESATMPKSIRVTVVKVIPEGATFKVEACNNGFDTNPTWRDITSKVNAGSIYDFPEDSTKTATKWGVNVKVTVDRNGKSGACYITEIGGNFE